MDKLSAIENKYHIFSQIFILLLILYFSGLYSFYLFHISIELFCVVIAIGIFIVAWNSRRFSDNNFLLFIGIAYLFVGAIDILHIFSHPELSLLRSNSINLDQQFRTAGRYLEAFSYFLAIILIGRKIRPSLIFLGYLVAFTGLVLSILHWKIFPVAFNPDVGATLFKIISDYVTVSIFMIAGILLARKKVGVDPEVRNILLFVILSETLYVLIHAPYTGSYSVSNMLAHSLRFISFYLLYKAVIETSLMQPYRVLFKSLKDRERSLEKAQIGLEFKVSQRTKELAKANIDLRREIAQRSKAERELLSAYEYLGVMNRKISALLDLNANLKKKKDIIDYILATAMNFSKASVGAIFIQDGEDNRFHMAISNGLKKDQKDQLKKVKISNFDFLKYLIREKVIIRGVAKEHDLGYLDVYQKLRYFLALPFLLNNAVRGFLFLGFTKKDGLDSHEVEFFNVFAVNASLALFNAGIIKK